MMRKSILAVAVLALLGGWAQTASAAPIMFTLANTALGPSPYGTITLADGGGGVLVTVDLADGIYLINKGLGWNLDPDVNPLSATGFSSPYYSLFNSVPGSYEMDGWGRFEYHLDAPNWGSGHAVNLLSFTLPGVTASQFVSNAHDIEFTAEVAYAPGGPGTTAMATGFVATGESPVVPEPASLVLLGTGLIGLAARARRRHKK